MKWLDTSQIRNPRPGELLLCVLACLAVVLCCPSTRALAQNPVPPQAVQAASQGLQHYTTQLPASELARLGLSTPEDIRHAVLGQPVEMRLLDGSAIQASGEMQRLDPLLVATDTWLFPVLVNGEPRTLITVSKLKGNWQVVEFGGANQARAMAEAGAQIDRQLSSQGSPPTGARLFVRAPLLSQDYYLYEAQGEQMLLPVAGRGSDAPTGSLSAREVLTQLEAASQERPAAPPQQDVPLGGAGGPASGPNRELLIAALVALSAASLFSFFWLWKKRSAR